MSISVLSKLVDANGNPLFSNIGVSGNLMVLLSATGDGSTTAFTLSTIPSSVNAILVSINGLLQTPTTDYTISSSGITFVAAPYSGSTITVMYVPASAIPRYISITIENQPSAGEVYPRLVMPTAGTFQTATCFANVATAPTASAVFNISDNGNVIGTITFAANATSGTFSFTTTTFSANDVLTITSPATVDTTLANVAITLSYQ